MLTAATLRGSFVALVTPFQVRDLSVDEEKFRDLIERQISAGTDGIVVAGTTGESATLTHEEHRRLIDIAIDEVKGRVAVIAGAGSNNTVEAVGLAEHARTSGADAILSISPYYNKPTQTGILAHYRKIADVGMPLILYNVPARTGRNMEAATTLELAEYPNIIGVKEASGDLTQIREICEKKPENFAVISGEDSQTLEIIKLGGVGAIAVITNEIPAEFGELIRLALAGKFDEAQKIHDQYAELMAVNFADNNPMDVKWALALMGILPFAVRLPLTEPFPGSQEKIARALGKLDLKKP